jgi:hypothetical protein
METVKVLAKGQVVIPEREMWLHRNPEALDAVVEAIGRLKEGQFAESPPDVSR